MVPGSSESAATGAAYGWAELAGGRWERAGEAFRSALSAEQTPEALEGLSWAAWWLDDAEQVFSAREAAYRLYAERGDRASAARMATWLASDELDFRAAAAVANGWVARARRLLEPLEPGPEHGWLAFVEGYIAHGRGDTARCAELARVTTDLGRRLEVPDLEMLGLALEGATLVGCARVQDGMQRLDEATATAMGGTASIPIAPAWTCCFMVTACAAVRDYERAFDWCDRIAELADRYGSRYMLAFCRSEYGAVHLWRGRWSDAESVLEASVADFARSRPALVGPPLTMLAELRRRQGRTDEAVRLLDRAEPSAGARLGRARVALDADDGARAAELAERHLRQLPPHRKLERAPALELLVRARTACGDLAAAGTALEALREAARAVGTEPLRAGAELAEGILAAAAGAYPEAVRSLEDAVDRFERCGGRFEAAEARTELASALLGSGQVGAARREAAVALAQLAELGAVVAADRARELLEAPRAPTPPLPEVTEREREVLRLVAEGLTNQQIAERLFVSEHTVHRHVTNILRKLGLPTRTAAAARAVRAGLLDSHAR